MTAQKNQVCFLDPDMLQLTVLHSKAALCEILFPKNCYGNLIKTCCMLVVSHPVSPHTHSLFPVSFENMSSGNLFIKIKEKSAV